MRRFFYALLNPKSGCDLHRILWPIRHTEPDFPDLQFDISLTDPFYPYTYYCMHGATPLTNIPYLGQWKRNGGKWILSLDDDFVSVPSWNPAKLSNEQLDIYHATLDIADVILSSTPELTKILGKQDKTLTAPNLIQVEDYMISEPAPTSQPIRILWAGSKTHRLDLELLEKPLDYILEKYKGAVEFICVGTGPDLITKKWLYRGFHLEPGVPIAVYPQLINKIRPHIVLAPLVDCVFNRSKSNIRILEGWSTAAAVVGSPVGEYRVIRHGQDGLHAITERDWIDCLELLINDHSYREGLGTAGRKRVAEEWNWNTPACREPWREVIRELIKRA